LDGKRSFRRFATQDDPEITRVARTYPGVTEVKQNNKSKARRFTDEKHEKSTANFRADP